MTAAVTKNDMRQAWKLASLYASTQEGKLIDIRVNHHHATVAILDRQRIIRRSLILEDK